MVHQNHAGQVDHLLYFLLCFASGSPKLLSQRPWTKEHFGFLPEVPFRQKKKSWGSPRRLTDQCCSPETCFCPLTPTLSPWILNLCREPPAGPWKYELHQVWSGPLVWMPRAEKMKYTSTVGWAMFTLREQWQIDSQWMANSLSLQWSEHTPVP